MPVCRKPLRTFRHRPPGACEAVRPEHDEGRCPDDPPRRSARASGTVDRLRTHQRRGSPLVEVVRAAGNWPRRTLQIIRLVDNLQGSFPASQSRQSARPSRVRPLWLCWAHARSARPLSPTASRIRHLLYTSTSKPMTTAPGSQTPAFFSTITRIVSSSSMKSIESPSSSPRCAA